MGRDWKLINVVLLGLGFMLVFTAFQTTSMIGKYVTDSVKKEKIETPEFLDNFGIYKEANYDEYKAREAEIVEGWNKVVLKYIYILPRIRWC